MTSNCNCISHCDSWSCARISIPVPPAAPPDCTPLLLPPPLVSRTFCASIDSCCTSLCSPSVAVAGAPPATPSPPRLLHPRTSFTPAPPLPIFHSPLTGTSCRASRNFPTSTPNCTPSPRTLPLLTLITPHPSGAVGRAAGCDKWASSCCFLLVAKVTSEWSDRCGGFYWTSS